MGEVVLKLCGIISLQHGYVYEYSLSCMQAYKTKVKTILLQTGYWLKITNYINFLHALSIPNSWDAHHPTHSRAQLLTCMEASQIMGPRSRSWKNSSTSKRCESGRHRQKLVFCPHTNEELCMEIACTPAHQSINRAKGSKQSWHSPRLQHEFVYVENARVGTMYINRY